MAIKKYRLLPSLLLLLWAQASFSEHDWTGWYHAKGNHTIYPSEVEGTGDICFLGSSPVMSRIETLHTDGRRAKHGVSSKYYGYTHTHTSTDELVDIHVEGPMVYMKRISLNECVQISKERAPSEFRKLGPTEADKAKNNADRRQRDID